MKINYSNNLKTQIFNCKVERSGDVLTDLLKSRGIESEKDYKTFSETSLLKLRSPFVYAKMQEAVDMILAAVQNREKILIYGDYDADGISASCILQVFFAALQANAEIFIPSRFADGYGLTVSAIEKILPQKPQLLITVDCGTNSVAEVKSLQAHGIKVLVTDHHLSNGKNVGAICPLINPLTESPSLAPAESPCGAFLAYKLTQAVLSQMDEAMQKMLKPSLHDIFLCLAGIATIADVMPLCGENRILVKNVIAILKSEDCPPAIAQLLQQLAGKTGFTGRHELTAKDLAYYLCPCINAAGRLGKVQGAIDALTSTNETDKKAASLIALNAERQDITSGIMVEAQDFIRTNPEYDGTVVAAYGNNWHRGVLGIIAGKLAETYHKPALCFSLEDGILYGSGRSYGNFDLHALIAKVSKLLLTFGGHREALGLSLKFQDFSEFYREITSEASRGLMTGLESNTISVDLEVLPREIDFSLYALREFLEPLGEGNQEPIYVCRQLKIVRINTLGTDSDHLKLFATPLSDDQQSGAALEIIGFGKGDLIRLFQTQDIVDVAGKLVINNFKGQRSLQFRLEAMAPTLEVERQQLVLTALFQRLGIEKIGFIDAVTLRTALSGEADAKAFVQAKPVRTEGEAEFGHDFTTKVQASALYPRDLAIHLKDSDFKYLWLFFTGLADSKAAGYSLSLIRAARLYNRIYNRDISAADFLTAALIYAEIGILKLLVASDQTYITVQTLKQTASVAIKNSLVYKKLLA